MASSSPSELGHILVTRPNLPLLKRNAQQRSTAHQRVHLTLEVGATRPLTSFLGVLVPNARTSTKKPNLGRGRI
jgi:hypothetical protein